MKTEKLTSAEEEVLNALWELGDSTVRDVQKHLKETKTPYTTFATIFRVLEKKGIIKHKSVGRTYLYSPALTKEEYMNKSISGILNKYFEGSFTQMASFFANENDISMKELREMMQDIEEDLE